MEQKNSTPSPEKKARPGKVIDSDPDLRGKTVVFHTKPIPVSKVRLLADGSTEKYQDMVERWPAFPVGAAPVRKGDACSLKVAFARGVQVRTDVPFSEKPAVDHWSLT